MSEVRPPDFSKIKLVKDKTELLLNLGSVFDAVVKGECLDVGEKEIELIISKELNIDLNAIRENIRPMLLESLTYYMVVWPGWQRIDEYYKGVLSREDWFHRFQQYLLLKTHFVIKSAVQFLHEEVSKNLKDVSTQTEANFNDKRHRQFASYGLCIAGPAPVLNNIVFVKSQDNILVKQFPIKEWKELNLTEFLNWPNVSVEFKLLDISFSRTMGHQAHRYMALNSDLVNVQEVNYIMHTKRLSENIKLKSFTHNFVQCYSKQLKEILENNELQIDEPLLDLDTIFTEFLNDIAEVDLHKKTVCTGMSVGYNIGRSKYIRSRKLVKSQVNQLQELINFYELLIPQVDFTLYSFDAMQDEDKGETPSFKSLNELEERLKHNPEEKQRLRLLIQECVVYKCTACSKTFVGQSAKNSAMEHFQMVHKGEQSVLCYKCHRQFDFKTLANSRWFHYC